MNRRLRAVLSVLLADARSHPLQTAAVVAGVATGVAVIVAIHLASEASLQRFQGTFEALSGNTTHQLVGVLPLDAARLTELLADPAVEAAHPVIAATLVSPPELGREEPAALRLVGVDPLLAGPFLALDPEVLATASGGRLFERLLIEPGLVAAAPATLARLGRKGGGPIRLLGPQGPFEVQATPLPDARLALEDPAVLLTDLATAQELLSLGTRVLRFDLVCRTEDVRLAAGERLERSERRGERAATLTRAFRLNLLCLGFLAVLVGAFLAFEMAQFATTRRRPLLGRLRCLGCPARDLLRATLLEAGWLGLMAGTLGVGAGRLLAESLVEDVARTMRTLYGPLGSVTLTLDLATSAVAIAVGTLATVAATWGPAKDAARTPPAVVAGRAAPDVLPSPKVVGALSALSLVLLLPMGSAVLLPAASILCALLAVASALPHVLARLSVRTPRRMLPALAVGRLRGSVGRTGGAAGALVMPLAMTVAVLVMVGSLRREVSRWSEAILAADLYVRPLYLELSPDTARLPPDVLAALAAHPAVADLDVLRVHEVVSGDRSFQVAGARHQALRQRGSMRVLAGGSLEVLLARLDQGEALISEPLARRFALRPGDELPLQERAGPTSVRVAGVFQDFSLDRGVALLSEESFLARFGDPGIRGAALLLRPGADPEVVRGQLAAALPGVELRTVQRLRAHVLEAFQDTFAVAWVLSAISTALALVGILTAVLCLHVERSAELGVLRALGARRRTIGALLLLEALTLVALATVAALPTGLFLAWILVSVVNTRSFGWSFPIRVDPGAILVVVALAIGAALLAGLVPWILVGRRRPAELLETDA